MLLSGGKDSSYALAQLVDLGLKVKAVTLDNGFISEGAKKNIAETVRRLEVPHEYMSTSAMNEIFVDSLRRHSNVCNGCFKTLYTLSTYKALEDNIPVIVTGLSRGQFFETRLTEELFRKQAFLDGIDETILEARKAYHRVPDAVKELLDTSVFDTDEVFEKVHFVDFYRYCDVDMSELYSYLRERLDWQRPTDTGRSTNCLINDLGIYLHKKQRGFHNYAFPYSWDVRLGHKQRDEAIGELNDELNPKELRSIMEEIGYQELLQSLFSAYVQTDRALTTDEIRSALAEKLPQQLIPKNFILLPKIPMTLNGKVDLEKLRGRVEQGEDKRGFTAPRNEIEELVSSIWCESFNLEKISVFDNFLSIGGHSLTAIKIVSRVQEQLYLKIPVSLLFEKSTIAEMSDFLEQRIIAELSSS